MIKTSFWVAVLLVLGFVFSFVKEATIASVFGISSDVDCFIIATQIPITLFAFISVAINSICIPIYSDILYNKGKKEANAYASNLLTVITLILLLFVVLFELFPKYLIILFAPGFSEENLNFSALMLRLTLPFVILTIISQVYIAILNVNKSFILPSLTSVILNIAIILSILLLYKKYGIVSACIGHIVGTLFYSLFLIFITKKYYKYNLILEIRDAYLKKSLKMSFPIIWSISVAQINAMINRAVASFLFVGAIASLSYASKICEIAYTLLITSISTIIYPMFAESAAKGNTEELSVRVNYTISLFAFFMMPVMVLMIIYNEEIVQIAFSRGRFDSAAVSQTAIILAFYSLGMVFNSFRETLTKVFYSLKDTYTPSKNATIGVISNIVFNVTLPFVMGVVGLALGSSLAAIIISLLLLFQISHSKKLNLSFFYGNVVKLLPIALFCAILTVMFHKYVLMENVYIRLGVGAFFVLISYILFTSLAKVKIFISLLNKLICK